MSRPASGLDAARAIGVYTWVAAGVTAAFAAGSLVVGSPTPAVSAGIMLAAVALIGLPHGAYDLEVGRRLFSERLGRVWWAAFGAAYCVLVVIGVGFWMLAPLAGLVLLLMGGSVHWGVDDLEESHHAKPMRVVMRIWLGASRGAVPIAAPMLLCSDEVARIFAVLLSGMPVDASTVSMLGAAWLSLAVPGLVYGIRHAFALGTPHGLRSIGEPAVLLLLFASTSATLGFVVYFCLWHSVRHSIRSACGASDQHRSAWLATLGYLRAVWFPTLLTWLIAGAVYWFGTDVMS
ncbi:MAG: Brp/Blh family beta-carotene 15,15'-dioxygenase, partial [Planctomycetota bacterium]